MTSGKIIFITLLAGLLSVGAGLVGHKYLGTQGPERKTGFISQPPQARTTLPEISLPDLDGDPVPSNRWGGKVLVLNFWATWCPPCRSEIPTFIRLQEELGSRGLQFVGIAVDLPQQVREFVRDSGINYPVLLGNESSVTLSKELGNRLQGLPFSVIFDRQGRVRYTQAGELTEKTLREQIAALL